MKKWIKISIIIISTIILIGGSIFGAIKIQENQKAKQIAMEKEKLMMTYVELNYSFHMTTGDPRDNERFGIYIPFPAPTEEYNKFGIDSDIYLYLKMYESRTGKTLTYESVVDYFSQEFESDGSLRLYNNGLHPEIQAYVEWAQERRDEMDEYVSTIERLYFEYYQKNTELELIIFYGLSPQMYDELVKKEADPNYELDLLSLQEQGY